MITLRYGNIYHITSPLLGQSTGGFTSHNTLRAGYNWHIVTVAIIKMTEAQRLIIETEKDNDR